MQAAYALGVSFVKQLAAQMHDSSHCCSDPLLLNMADVLARNFNHAGTMHD